MTTWEEALGRKGCRITASRRAVMEVLADAEVPLAPQTIYERGRAVHPKLGLVTVYRALELFTDLDLVSRVHHGDGCHGYVLSTPGHRHVMLCRGCGRAVEFLGENDLDELIARIETRTGYRIEEHLLQLSGLCPDCQS
ncbi:MAG: transcriptional repressor [Anaerolineae bacterium]|nr:transcriptional repressor [Anaerolineae bacterium]